MSDNALTRPDLNRPGEETNWLGRRPPELRPYDPSWRDQLGAMIAGDDRDSFRQLLANRLMGTRGMGHDVNAPMPIVPVLPSAIDSADNAVHGYPLAAAGYAALAGIEGGALGKVPAAIKSVAAPFLRRSGEFEIPFAGAKGAGEVFGKVSGTTADIKGAFYDLSPHSAGLENTVGVREMRRALEEIKTQFPHVNRVVSDRISGARHGGVMQDLSAPIDSRSSMEMTFTPQWEKEFNSAWKRGTK